MQALLDIGLSYYQETQWISAIKLYGQSIMDKSLLSQSQKQALINEFNRQSLIEQGQKQQAKLSFYND